MAQSGFTPIQLYRATTPTLVPSAGNLAAGELAINLADEKLYFKNASGVVKLLADSAVVGTVTSVAASGGTTGLTFSGSPITSSGTLTLSGTLAVTNGGTGATTFTSGRLLRGNGTSAVTASIVGDDGATATVNGALITTGAASLRGNVELSGSVTSGYGVSTAAVALELGGLRSGDGATFVDFHATAGTDFESRIIRDPGVNGNFQIANTGTGSMLLTTIGAAPMVFQTTSNERMRITAAGDVGIGNTPSGTYKLEVTGGLFASSAVLGAALPVASGGTGLTSTPANGAVDIGNGTGFTRATLTAGSGVSITNGAGSITIAATGSGGTVTSVAASGGTTGLSFTGSPITTAGTLTLTGTLAVTNGGTGGTDASTARTGLGATTIGANMFTLTNPSAVTFPRFNTDNTVSALNAADFRTAIGAGSGGGSVTSVSGTGTVNGITLTGTVTSSGSLTLGGTLSNVSLTTQVTGTLPVANGGTGATTAGAALSALGGAASGAVGSSGLTMNTARMLGRTTASAGAIEEITIGSGLSLSAGTLVATASGGTVTSVAASGGTTGLSFTGSPITSSGTLTLTGTLAVANGGTGATTASAARTALGSTTVGDNLFTLTNPSAVRFLRVNTDNTVSALDAANFRTAIGAGTGSGTVTSVNADGGTTGLSFSGGPVTGSGTLTLAGTLAVTNGGTGGTTQSTARSGLGATIVGANFFTLTNPSSVTFVRVNADNTISTLDAPTFRTAIGAGTVTSVGGTGSANGLSLSGTVTGTGNITLSGSVTSVATTATIDGVTIGYRSIPRSTTSGTAVVGDVGKCIAVSAGITIPNSTFAAGDAVSIYNDSGSAITITAGVTTLRQAGTGNTGNRTLAARGMATVWFNSATEAVISGAGVS